ncbi:septum site-determining protein MinC [Bordetella bronchialis]|uniref:septum site-determining protein MinC n=1 Tax=Bordetella bronchialis TaxID=463025 RepID=UPI0039EEE97B
MTAAPAPQATDETTPAADAGPTTGTGTATSGGDAAATASSPGDAEAAASPAGSPGATKPGPTPAASAAVEGSVGGPAQLGQAGGAAGTAPGRSREPLPSRAARETTSSASPTPADPQSSSALVISRPLRSGQRVYARHTDLVVIGMVSPGAEVIADGNVHVYGPLRGKAMAGARGDTSARIFTTHLDAELLAVAGVYRVVEDKLDATLHGQAALIRLDGDTLRIEALKA